jgi:hypothetical protein
MMADGNDFIDFAEKLLSGKTRLRGYQPLPADISILDDYPSLSPLTLLACLESKYK